MSTAATFHFFVVCQRHFTGKVLHFIIWIFFAAVETLQRWCRCHHHCRGAERWQQRKQKMAESYRLSVFAFFFPLPTCLLMLHIPPWNKPCPFIHKLPGSMHLHTPDTSVHSCTLFPHKENFDLRNHRLFRVDMFSTPLRKGGVHIGANRLLPEQSEEKSLGSFHLKSVNMWTSAYLRVGGRLDIAT